MGGMDFPFPLYFNRLGMINGGHPVRHGAAERFQAIENVSKNGSFGHKILPSNEAQVRPLTQLSDAEAVHVWAQVTEQHERPIVSANIR